jgi:hypothetical protein
MCTHDTHINTVTTYHDELSNGTAEHHGTVLLACGTVLLLSTTTESDLFLRITVSMTTRHSSGTVAHCY